MEGKLGIQNPTCSSRTSKASGDESEGKQSSVEGRKEEMDESRSQQAALAVRAGREATWEGSCKACRPSPHRTHGSATPGVEGSWEKLAPSR